MLSLPINNETFMPYLAETITDKNFFLFQRMLSISDVDDFRVIAKGLVNYVITPDDLIQLKGFTPADVKSFIKGNIVFNDFIKYLDHDEFNMRKFYSIATVYGLGEQVAMSVKAETHKIRPFKYFLGITLEPDHYTTPSLDTQLRTIADEITTSNGMTIDTLFPTDIGAENSTESLAYQSIYYAFAGKDVISSLLSYGDNISKLIAYPAVSKYLLTYTSPMFYKYILNEFTSRMESDDVTKDFLESEVTTALAYNASVTLNPTLLLNQFTFLVELCDNYELITSETIAGKDRLQSVLSFLTNLRNEQEEWMTHFFTRVRNTLNGNFPLLPSNEQLS